MDELPSLESAILIVSPSPSAVCMCVGICKHAEGKRELDRETGRGDMLVGVVNKEKQTRRNNCAALYCI